MYQHKTSPCRRCSNSARPITTERSYRSDMKMLGTTDRLEHALRDWLGCLAVSKVLARPGCAMAASSANLLCLLGHNQMCKRWPERYLQCHPKSMLKHVTPFINPQLPS